MRHVSDPRASAPQPWDQTIIGWMWRWSGVVLPCMLPNLEQTDILCTMSFVKHMQPTFGEAVRGNPQSLVLIRPEKGAVVP
jgi:hypothetical protein